MKTVTKDQFLERAISKHGTKYSYTECNYINTVTKITINCPNHGNFQQSPEKHMAGQGCPTCGRNTAAKAKEKSTADFVKKARKIHGDNYDYADTIYVSAKAKLNIRCPQHGVFSQLASGHLSGYGCKHCATHGKGRVDMTKPCKVYYLHITGTNLYKIGITTKSVEDRYRTKFDRDQFTVVFTKFFDTGREAYEYEQALLKTYSHKRYLGPKQLHTGNTELFSEDVFAGDYPT